MKSIWTESVTLPTFAALKRDIKTDVLVIGGGIAGILCAYMLKKNEIDYALVEAAEICSGITKNTTAKITSQHGLVYDYLIRKFGCEKARMYYEANQSALEEFRRLCEKIDCDFESKNAFVYSRQGCENIEKELSALEKIKARAEFVSSVSLPFEISGAIKFENQAQFNPLKFLSAVAKELNIYEHTKVNELIGNTAVTNGGRINAKKIIVATHFPFINKHGGYFVKMYQQRSYVIALEGAADIDGMYIDEAENGMSFRNYKNLLLVGGGGHRTGEHGGAWHELENFSTKYYPNAPLKYRFATQDCISLDKIPYIGAYSGGTKNMYVATGFNKWGMTSSMLAANLLTDMILGRKNEYAEVFSPSRTVLRKGLFKNAASAVTNLLTPTKKRCPHLGCALKRNSAEHTWDCPCHGSRFTDGGKLIDNPATGDLK